MGGRLWDWLALLLVATIVYVLVRPRSKAAELVEALGSAFAAMVRTATDLAGEG